MRDSKFATYVWTQIKQALEPGHYEIMHLMIKHEIPAGI